MAQTAPMQGEARQDGSSRRARLLIVEDDAKMRRILELLLSDQWDVEVANDGRQALERTERSTPDLVLTDLLLPGMDGFELTRALRAAPRTSAVPIVVISGLTEEADRLRALEAGANDFLIKPFSERELHLRVATHLEMASLRRQAALRETETHLRLILDGALDAVVSTDAADVITYWNPQAEKTFGWTAGEAIGRRFGELILPPEPRQDHDRDMKHFLATGEAPSVNRRTEVEGQRKDGSRLPLELAISAVKVWDECTFNVFARDVTEQRRADEERTQLLERRKRSAAPRTSSWPCFPTSCALLSRPSWDGRTCCARASSTLRPVRGPSRPSTATPSCRTSSSRTSWTSPGSWPGSSTSRCARWTWRR